MGKVTNCEAGWCFLHVLGQECGFLQGKEGNWLLLLKEYLFLSCHSLGSNYWPWCSPATKRKNKSLEHLHPGHLAVEQNLYLALRKSCSFQIEIHVGSQLTKMFSCSLKIKYVHVAVPLPPQGKGKQIFPPQTTNEGVSPRGFATQYLIGRLLKWTKCPGVEWNRQ